MNKTEAMLNLTNVRINQTEAMLILTNVIEDCRASVDSLRGNSSIPLDMRVELASDFESVIYRLAIASEILDGQWD